MFRNRHTRDPFFPLSSCARTVAIGRDEILKRKAGIDETKRKIENKIPKVPEFCFKTGNLADTTKKICACM